MKWLYGYITDFTDQEYEAAYHTLSPTRRERINSLKKPLDRKRSLAGELLMRRLLADEYGVNDGIIEVSPNGKPVVSTKGLFISIAHSSDMVVCAADDKGIGIDVEKIKPINISVAKKFCVAEELDYIVKDFDCNKLGYCEQRDILCRFYEIWTAKEAYFKSLGTGITKLKSVNTLELTRNIFYKDNYIIQIIN